MVESYNQVLGYKGVHRGHHSYQDHLAITVIRTTTELVLLVTQPAGMVLTIGIHAVLFFAFQAIPLFVIQALLLSGTQSAPLLVIQVELMSVVEVQLSQAVKVTQGVVDSWVVLLVSQVSNNGYTDPAARAYYEKTTTILSHNNISRAAGSV